MIPVRAHTQKKLFGRRLPVRLQEIRFGSWTKLVGHIVFFGAAGENFGGFGDCFTLKTRFWVILGCVFCVNFFLILQNFLPVVDIGPPRTLVEQISLADFERCNRLLTTCMWSD